MGSAGSAAKLDLRREMAQRLRSAEGQGGWELRLSSLQCGVVQWCGGCLASGAVVTLFGGLKREVDLLGHCLETLREMGLRTAAFQMDEHELGRMEAVEVFGMEDLRRGKMGVWEPKEMGCRRLAPEEVGAVLVPGLAFSWRTGFRVGRGGGYFDRYLSRLGGEVKRVGVALECQVLAEVPHEEHDRAVQWLLTEEGSREVGNQRLAGW